ncbi:MAG: hypothetical protein HY652_14245 [Acidobacteria bacterium]|nr:hypothetical protein [Acidobacteriota bacterium]
MTIVFAMVFWLSVGKDAVVHGSDYPAPRYPQTPKVQRPEDLLDVARVLVKRPSTGQGAFPGYAIKPGERALIVVSTLHDRLIYEAIAMAIREAGARADLFIGQAPDLKGEGAEEPKLFLYMYAGDKNIERMSAGGLTFDQVAKMAELGDYDILIAGFGGPKPPTPHFRWEEIPWLTVDTFMAGLATFPFELQAAIDRKAWDLLSRARRIRVTDPEGTDVSWTVPPNLFGSKINNPGHLMAIPDGYFGEKPNLAGVIAGTINHTGAFPHIKVHVKSNRIERIEGGGSYGEGWQAVLKKYESTHWPGHPGPGFGWVHECAIGTNPKAGRPVNVTQLPTGTVWERRRSGVIHWGIGVHLSLERGPLRSFIEEKGVPDGHFHVHNNFPTMILETEGGEKITFIDKGRLTVLDDPSIRDLAARFSDPDQLLKEAWIPPVPGINIEGDYFKDYATSPLPWIAREGHKQPAKD